MTCSANGIVILNYKSHDLTLALAERAATFPNVDYVCVVDDAASDDFAGDFSSPKIHYIKSWVNGGYLAGINIGSLAHRGEGLRLRLHRQPGCDFWDDPIAAIVGLFDSDPTVGIASARRSGHAGPAFTGLRLPDLRQRTEVLLLPHEEEVRSRAAGPSKRSGRGRGRRALGRAVRLDGRPAIPRPYKDRPCVETFDAKTNEIIRAIEVE